jgi:hypothetical protein
VNLDPRHYDQDDSRLGKLQHGLASKPGMSQDEGLEDQGRVNDLGEEKGYFEAVSRYPDCPGLRHGPSLRCLKISHPSCAIVGVGLLTVFVEA